MFTALILLSGMAVQSGWAAPAPSGPGAVSHFDLARKDCVGTARNTASKVWFTVAGGVLSDVYEPTIDTTNVETLQYVVTDGSTFTDLQTRDTTYSVRPLGPSGLTCRVTTTATASGVVLDRADLNRIADDPALWEKVIRKLRTGAMPPEGAPQPDRAVRRAPHAPAYAMRSVLPPAPFQTPRDRSAIHPASRIDAGVAAGHAHCGRSACVDQGAHRLPTSPYRHMRHM